MIKNLVKAAAELDEAGFHIEADLMDKIMQKVAEKMSDSEDEDEEPEFGFMGQEDEDEEEGSEMEEEEMDSDEEHTVDECLDYCRAFSHEEKIELIKALLDSMAE